MGALLMRIKNLKYVSKIAYAFTLAEVLVVITIIGVVAALTIPVVSSNVQDSVLKAQIKKSYSTFVNAFNLWVAKYDYDHPSKVATKYGGGGHYPTQLLNEWATVMNFIKTCKDPSAEGCWHKKWYDFEGYENSALDPKFNAGGILPDGSFIVMDCFATGPTFQGYVTFKIDENGPKPPNTINKDIFEFTL